MTDHDTVTETDAPTAESAPAGADTMQQSGGAGAGKKALGLERWVQLGYVVAALLLVWLYQNAITAIWYNFADPNESVVTLAAVIGGLVTAGLLYKHQGLNQLTHEIADELSKVTWPAKSETNSHTVVVIVTSIIAALFIALFDTVWGKLTDLIYKV